MLEFPDTVRLVEGIQQSIDDVQGLNAIQETAFAVCKGRFNWGDRGRRLAEELRQAHA
jgi:hypothetical protein